MASFTQIFYHIVFSTKNRERTLNSQRREELYQYIWGIFKNKKCALYRINGTEDHLHILCDLHPTVPLADLIKDIKLASSRWIKDKTVFPKFTYWQEGYGAFTHSKKDKKRLVNYITNQLEHHKKRSFQDELCALLIEAGIDFDERFLV